MPNSPKSGRAAPLARSRQVTRRRLLLEPLEGRNLLAAIAVPTSPAIFDTTSPGGHAEGANAVAAVTALGHTPQTFTDLSASAVAAALAAADAVLIPEQEFASLNAALSSAAKTQLAQFVNSGHGMIVLGSPAGRAESLLNGLFGFSLTAGAYPDGVSILNGGEATGTAFATAPFAIFNNVTEVTAFDISNLASLPAGTKLPYQYGSVAPVGLFSYGQGEIVYLGYDFDNPAGQSNTGNWKTLLGAAIDQVAAALPPATTSVELLAGDLVITDLASANDSISISADSQQWKITITSGLFSAPSAIAGVTIAGDTVTIDKSLATAFTGKFTVQSGVGNDVLTVSLDDLGRDVQFDGGESAGDHDELRVVSTAILNSLTSAPDMTGGGILDVGSDGDAEIVYAGLEPVDLTGTSVQELHFVVPPGITTAELSDYLAPNDDFSQLAFGGAGPENQFFRHPAQLLAVHTAGSSLVTLFTLDSATTIPRFLADGMATDLFRMGATTGIRSGTSLTLVAASLDLNGQSPTIDGLAGSGTITNSANTNSLLTIGTLGTGGQFDGLISDGWPVSSPPPTTRQVGLAKTGTGTLILTNSNTYSGTTTIAGGELVLDGSLNPSSEVVVAGGGTLAGTGTVGGPVVVQSGGKIAAGSPSSSLGSNRGSSELWQAGSHFAVQLGGTIPSIGHDQRLLGESLSLAGAFLDVSLVGGFVPGQSPPMALKIVDNQGAMPVDGEFSGLAEGAQVNIPGSPVPVFITYQGGDGNDIALFTVASSQLLGTGGDDSLILRRQAGADDRYLEYSLNGGPFVPLNDLDSLDIALGAGSDLVTLDFVNGEPVPPMGLKIDGGTPASGTPGDRLVLLGAGDAAGIIYRPDDSAGAQGTIELTGGGGVIELAALEAIDATALGHVTLATAAAGSDLDITDAADAGTGLHAALRASGTSGGEGIAPLHVWSVDNFTIDTSAGGGNDRVSIVSAVGNHGIGNLHLATGGQAGDRTVVGATSVSGDLVIDSGTVRIGGTVHVGGSIDVASHGLLRSDAPIVAQQEVRLTTTDEPGLDADLAIEATVSSVLAGMVLTSADHAIIRGDLSVATTINIAIDTGNTDLGGNTLYLQAAVVAPGGTTAMGNVEADRFEVEPQVGSALLIVGGSPAAAQANSQSQNAINGDVPGDTLVLDMTTAGDGQQVIGPVIVDSVGGEAKSQNTLPITFRGIEDLDVLDGGTLTTTQQGDIYVRGTDRDERIYVEHDGSADPRFRVGIQGRVFPENQGYFGPYLAGRSVIVYARGGNDVLDLSSTPLRGEFHGESGDDYLAGAGRDDLLIGGPGRDTLLGGSQGGGDELWGDDFDPIPKDTDGNALANATAADFQANRLWFATRISSTDGNDKLDAAGGDDRLYGQGGDDSLGSGGGNDYLSGGSGNDQLSGGDGSDRLYGNDGNDMLAGDAGNDLLSGGDGDDWLFGRLGNDVVIGGDGADYVFGNEDNDLLLGGIVSKDGATADSLVAGDAADQAMLALLLQWSTLAQVTGLTHQDDGDMDWLFGDSGSDRFASDGTSLNVDFVAGVDS